MIGPTLLRTRPLSSGGRDARPTQPRLRTHSHYPQNDEGVRSHQILRIAPLSAFSASVIMLSTMAAAGRMLHTSPTV